MFGPGVDVPGIPGQDHLSPRLTRRDRHGHGGFPPHERDLTLATFLLKILDPHFFRDGPDRASPRAIRKPEDFPARKDQPTHVVSVPDTELTPKSSLRS